jgi:polysaccharide pyruvyl transferase WcaK-like protein
VFANKSNIGDWLSARGIQSLLGKQPIKEYLCDEPYVDQTLEKLRSATEHDLIIVGGGGLFMDYFTAFWEGFREIAERVPFAIWGVGYCDLKREQSRASRPLLEDIIGKSRMCIVRDNHTRDHLDTCPLPPAVPCPSVCVVRSSRRRRFGLLHVDNYTTAGAEIYRVMEACGRDFARRTQRPFRQTNNRVQPGNMSDQAKLLGLYRKSDIVLSSALHGCIIGLAIGCKVLAVSGDYKIDSFMAAADLEEWVCDIGQIEDIGSRLNATVCQKSATLFIDRARAANRRVAAQIISISHSLRQKTDTAT